jgi:hypothetical protein
MDFSGSAQPLSSEGLAAAADRIGADLPTIWAVLKVETSGCGFLGDRRPQILFERHWFHRHTNGAFTAAAPDLCDPTAGGYGPGGAAQYDRLERAIALDRRAALRSTSWGIGQVMGFHAETLGHPDVEAMVAAMVESEDAQVAAMVAFIVHKGLRAALQQRDWRAFALGYNGQNFAKNRYDEKLAEHHGRLASGALPDLRVRSAQMRLLFRGFDPGPIDGEIGNRTRSALRLFQGKAGLGATGELDDETVAALASSRP